MLLLLLLLLDLFCCCQSRRSHLLQCHGGGLCYCLIANNAATQKKLTLNSKTAPATASFDDTF